MPTEVPKYRIHQPTLIKGAFFDNQHVPCEIDLPADKHEPRNSWEPLNEAARQAFKDRDARKLAKLDAEIKEITDEVAVLKEAGAGEAELEGFHAILSKLRVDRARMPKALKQVPSFGGETPTHSLVFHGGIVHGDKPTPAGVDSLIEAARKNGAPDEELAALRLERVVSAAVAGGASEADVQAIRSAFESGNSGKAGAAVAQAKENADKKGAAKAKAEAEAKAKADAAAKAKADEKPGEPRLND